MKGKVFSESNSLYQDEAKVLFDYYRQAAEKIVKEEERIEQKIASLQEEKRRVREEMNSLANWILYIVTLSIYYFIKKKQVETRIAELNAEIDSLETEKRNIFRDYKVTKLGVAYVPIAEQIKYEDKSFLVDLTGKVANSEMTVQVPRQNDLLISTISRLDDISQEAPIVETSRAVETVDTQNYSSSIKEVNVYDYMGSLEHSLDTIAECMADLDSTSVVLPLVEDKSDYLDEMAEYATSEVPDDAPVIKVFNEQRFASSINKFKELNKLRDSLSTEELQFEEVLKGLMRTMALSAQAISALKIASVDKLVLESNQELYTILKAPYNHYSPELEREEIEKIRKETFDYSDSVDSYEPFNMKLSSRVRFNPLTGMWVAEDGSTVVQPFGVHQIYEEVVAPTVLNLLRENRVERLRIYNHIKDQKISYLNKWHQDVDQFYLANRAQSADLINLMQESLRQYIAAYNTMINLRRTEESMEASGSLDSAVVQSESKTSEAERVFQRQADDFKQVQEEFEAFIDALKEDIDRQAEKFGHVEYFDARLRDGYSSASAVAASEVGDLDDRRRGLAQVNAHLAKMSELPPEPSVETVTYEHLALNLPNLASEALENLGGVPARLPKPKKKPRFTLAKEEAPRQKEEPKQEPKEEQKQEPKQEPKPQQEQEPEPKPGQEPGKNASSARGLSPRGSEQEPAPEQEQALEQEQAPEQPPFAFAQEEDGELDISDTDDDDDLDLDDLFDDDDDESK